MGFQSERRGVIPTGFECEQLGAIMMQGMVIDMNDEQLHTLAQLQASLDGTIEVDFAVAADERYDFIARTVRRLGYP